MDNEIKGKPGFIKWVVNFWYYNKYKVLLGLLIAVALVIGIYSCIAKNAPDITVMYTARTSMTNEQLEQMKKIIASYTDDVNKDGKVTVRLIFYPVNELTAIPATANPAIRANGTVYENITVQLFSGKPFIYLFDSDLYEYIKTSGALSDLNSVFGPDITGGSGEMYCFDAAAAGLFSPEGIDSFKNYDIKMGLRVYKGTPRENDKSFKQDYDVSYNPIKRMLEAAKKK